MINIEIVLHYAKKDKTFSQSYVSVELFVTCFGGRKKFIKSFDNCHDDNGYLKVFTFAKGIEWMAKINGHSIEIKETKVADIEL